ncbi:MAG: hypothetical protein RLZZ450_2166 [Pseudomonadota bacterium]|jgi:Na+/phosphate symporter
MAESRERVRVPEPLYSAHAATPARHHALAWLLSLAIVVLYVALPDAERDALEHAAEQNKDDVDEGERLEVRSVSPLEPYPGSTIIVSHNGVGDSSVLHVYAGKSELRVLARHEGELVARLPTQLPAGDLKIRLATGEITKPFHLRTLRTKPFHVRVKVPNWRKVFRSLVGGMALVALGIVLMSRGVRASTGLEVARVVTRTVRRRSVAYGFGALTGALAQSTTGAAGILAALASSSVLPVVAAALAFLGAQLGATVAPLLVTGLVEPREGLVAVVVGVVWLGLATDRRASAIGKLLLGAGFVAFGLQTFRPGLEPFLSDPVLLAMTEELRARSVTDVAACAFIGTVLVAAFQGPAPLILLILGVAQTTGHWDLCTALALLSGTGLGAALAALVTTSSGALPRKLARLNLLLGGASTLFTASTAALFAQLAHTLFGPQPEALHWTRRVSLSALGGELALAFVLSQLAAALLLCLAVERVFHWLERRKVKREALPSSEDEAAEVLRRELASVLLLLLAALDSTAVLAQTGARGFGQRAEHALDNARRALEKMLELRVNTLQHYSSLDDGLGGAAFSCLQLLGAVEALLSRAERATDARLSASAQYDANGLPWDDDLVLRELHALVSEGLSATGVCLTEQQAPDLDKARAREIKINRLEAHARGVLLEAAPTPQLVERRLQVLQVIDAYEVVGNQVYRLTESVGENTLPALL